jgi:Tfp pilus assembly protein PilV
MLEVLLAGVIFGLVASGLLAALLGANRSARQAGQYAAAAALAQSIIEEMRLLPAGDARLEPGDWDWCPPECPPRITRVTVSVSQPAGLPETLRRVEVLVERTGAELPVQVISYVRK